MYRIAIARSICRRGRCGLPTAYKRWVVLDFLNNCFPILIEALESGSAKTGIPVSKTSQKKPNYREECERIAPYTKFSSMVSQTGECSLRQIDSGIAIASIVRQGECPGRC